MDGEEGKFIMVTFWLVEAMSRVSFRMPKVIVRLNEQKSKLIVECIKQASRAKVHLSEHPPLMELHNKASTYFENVLSFANHLGIFSEEVSRSGEQVGNTPQAFSHLACISAAMNLAKG